jgi:hypothetical protein
MSALLMLADVAEMEAFGDIDNNNNNNNINYALALVRRLARFRCMRNIPPAITCAYNEQPTHPSVTRPDASHAGAREHPNLCHEDDSSSQQRAGLCDGQPQAPQNAPGMCEHVCSCYIGFRMP